MTAKQTTCSFRRVLIRAWSTGIPQTILCIALQILVMAWIPYAFRGNNIWEMVRVGENDIRLVPNTPLLRMDMCGLSCISGENPPMICNAQQDVLVTLAVAVSSIVTTFITIYVASDLICFLALNIFALNKGRHWDTVPVVTQRYYNNCRWAAFWILMELMSIAALALLIIFTWPDIELRSGMDILMVTSPVYVVAAILLILASAVFNGSSACSLQSVEERCDGEKDLERGTVKVDVDEDVTVKLKQEESINKPAVPWLVVRSSLGTVNGFVDY